MSWKKAEKIFEDRESQEGLLNGPTQRPPVLSASPLNVPHIKVQKFLHLFISVIFEPRTPAPFLGTIEYLSTIVSDAFTEIVCRHAGNSQSC
jgi:hypothetical protein